MKFFEIIGYITVLKGAGLIVPMCILEGITHFNYIHFQIGAWKVVNLDLSPLFWLGILVGLAMIVFGLYLASTSESQKNSV